MSTISAAEATKRRARRQVMADTINRDTVRSWAESAYITHLAANPGDTVGARQAMDVATAAKCDEISGA